MPEFKLNDFRLFTSSTATSEHAIEIESCDNYLYAPANLRYALVISMPMTVEFQNKRIRIMPTIRGFADEKTHLREAYKEIKPDAVAISISAEEYAGIKDADENKKFDNEPSSYDEIYVKGLRNFGEVKAPPPCWFEINRLCKEDNIPVHPVDMREKEFTDTYCTVVSTVDLLKYSLKIKKLRNAKIKAKNAEEFVTGLDRSVCSIDGFNKLENIREERMAKKLQELGNEYDNILAIVECERAEGVYDKLLKLTGAGKNKY